MGKIVFESCRVTINGKTKNYKDFQFTLDQVVDLSLNAKEMKCDITSVDGAKISIQYFSEPPIL